jgi:putative holliday junction resolvase
MGKILAIDYGGKRVGLAVSDPSRMIATGLTTVHSRDVIPFLQEYVSKETVDTIIVGLPKSLNNEATDATEMVENFIKHLTRTFPQLEIIPIDERFTSKLAMQTLVMGGAKKEKRKNKEIIDELSAVILLQGYMH